jgi:hypothetical protein
MLPTARAHPRNPRTRTTNSSEAVFNSPKVRVFEANFAKLTKEAEPESVVSVAVTPNGFEGDYVLPP